MSKAIYCELCKTEMYWGDFFMVKDNIWKKFCKLIKKEDCFCCISCFESIRNKSISVNELKPTALSVPLLLARNLTIPVTREWKNSVLIALSFFPPKYISAELNEEINKAWKDFQNDKK